MNDAIATPTWDFVFRANLADYTVLSTEYLTVSVKDPQPENAGDIAHEEAMARFCAMFEAEPEEIEMEEIVG